MISVFSNLMQNDELIDVTLLAENNEIHAHKIVLSACSPYFQVIQRMITYYSNIFTLKFFSNRNSFYGTHASIQ